MGSDGIKILDVSYKPVRIYLKKRFEIANENYSYCDVTLVKISAQNCYGIGEAAPDESVTGENIVTVKNSLSKFRATLIGREVSDVPSIMHDLDKLVSGNNTAKAGIDIALYDLLGKFKNKSVVSLLGGKGRSKETFITIGISSAKQSMEEAVFYKEKGFKSLKIKVGLDSEKDETRLRRIREVVGENIKIVVDANQGYSVGDAIAFSRKINDIGISFIEQPIKANDITGLKKVREASDIPIMADESLKSIEDLRRMLRIGAVDLINIKLMKSGGISKCAEIAELAEENGIGVMIGCMDETKVGVAAGMHFALTYENVGTVDLDSHLTHRNEVTYGGVSTSDGKNTIYKSKGLGLRLKRGIL